MTDIFQTLGWLNAIDNTSRLTNEDRQLIGAIGKLGLFDSGIEPVLERLQNTAHSTYDSFRKAEILLYCAAIGYSRGECPPAARDAIEAVIAYDIDHHRRAVALWMLGIIQWKMLQNYGAHRNWVEARRIFKQCRGPSHSSSIANGWYQNPIWQMDVELVSCPEEISTWLNYFERSSLRASTGQIVNAMKEKFRHRAYPSIYVLMQDLQEANKWCEKIHERAEIYLEFGLATYQMGNSYSAIEMLRKAVTNFYPGIGTYHKHVVARCMLGALEWMHKTSLKQAAADWMCCVDQFEELRGVAESDNSQEKAEWYLEHRDILRSALLERVEPVQRSEAGRSIPDENEPSPSVSAPSGETGYSYEDLLSMVRGDRAIADRLIEFERKKAPRADRNELIKRAIERWIHDNR